MTAKQKMSETGGEAMRPFSGRVPADVMDRIDDVAKGLSVPQSEVIRLAMWIGSAVLQAGGLCLQDYQRPRFNGIESADYYLGEDTRFDMAARARWKYQTHREREEIEMKLSASGALPLLHEAVAFPALEQLSLRLRSARATPDGDVEKFSTPKWMVCPRTAEEVERTIKSLETVLPALRKANDFWDEMAVDNMSRPRLDFGIDGAETQGPSDDKASEPKTEEDGEAK
jgi:hypothetical protein